MNFSQLQDLLIELHHAWSAIPKQWTLTGFCLCIASTAPDLRQHFLVHFLTTYMYGFGGGIITSLLVLDGSKAPITILYNPNFAATWILCWWIINYFPYRIPGRIHDTWPLKVRSIHDTLSLKVRSIHDTWPLKMLTKACIGYVKAQTMTSKINQACDIFPGAVLGPIMIGALSICGGKLSHDTIRWAHGTLKSPHELFSPTYSWRAAMLCSTAYFFLVKYSVTAFMHPQAVHATITTLLVGQVFASELTGLPMDWTKPIVSTILFLANIPAPAEQPAQRCRKFHDEMDSEERLQSPINKREGGRESHQAANARDNLNVASYIKVQPGHKSVTVLGTEDSIKITAHELQPVRSAHVHVEACRDTFLKDKVEPQQQNLAQASIKHSGAKKAAAVSDRGWTQVMNNKKRSASLSNKKEK
ncbi:hypothetical protein CEUSTIGMA_g992.t1 [Chlamydomonas eustigma]|uniref:Uncharacterized protein n=1 Tax=Chlamydomonas eustigma TaxID=1157962 RepID=A0A250WRY2_9CHLO|nr:hypothetical protein CEUSTIGMA_g992.t1 [Chlamydomonas eustigma]|eukprot:GAX73541.1 hypothetical protein CEUSTIGMA_g992.t1 [Chlamydomonas eustigma]